MSLPPALQARLLKRGIIKGWEDVLNAIDVVIWYLADSGASNEGDSNVRQCRRADGVLIYHNFFFLDRCGLEGSA